MDRQWRNSRSSEVKLLLFQFSVMHAVQGYQQAKYIFSTLWRCLCEFVATGGSTVNSTLNFYTLPSQLLVCQFTSEVVLLRIRRMLYRYIAPRMVKHIFTFRYLVLTLPLTTLYIIFTSYR